MLAAANSRGTQAAVAKMEEDTAAEEAAAAEPAAEVSSETNPVQLVASSCLAKHELRPRFAVRAGGARGGGRA